MNKLKNFLARFLRLRAVECLAALVLVTGGVIAYRGFTVDEYDGSDGTAQAVEAAADEYSGPADISYSNSSDPSGTYGKEFIITSEASSASDSDSDAEDDAYEDISAEDSGFDLRAGTLSESDLKQSLQSEQNSISGQTVVPDINEETTASETESQAAQVMSGSSSIIAGSGNVLYSGAYGPGSNSGSGSGTVVSSGSGSNSGAGSDTASDTIRVCSLIISCEPFLDDVSGSVRSRLPEDGIILPETEVEFRSGESVYDVLKRVCRAKGIPYRASNSYYGAYVSSIDNLSEKYYDYSTGWCYYVDGEYAMVSADNWQLEGGERIDWIYDSWSM